MGVYDGRISNYFFLFTLIEKGKHMKNQHDLTDIQKVITKALDNPMANLISSGVIGLIEISNPVAGTIAGLGNEVLSNYYTFKISHLLTGLSTGLDIEKKLNELYNFVNSSPKKAITVANLLRQTINAECPKVCVIYGRILADHMVDNTDFVYDELIVCKALENATDYDLKNFKEIMDKYTRKASNGNVIEFPKGSSKFLEFKTTCDWGVYNRIFVTRLGGVANETIDLDLHYYVTEVASLLLKYINDVQNIMSYEND